MKRYIKPTTAVYEAHLTATIMTGSNDFEVDQDPEHGVVAGESLVRDEYEDFRWTDHSEEW